MKKKQRRITTILFFIALLIIPLLTLLSKKENFSELENRTLQKSPKFSISGWFDRSFMNNFESYVADHFIGRSKWIKTKINTDLATGKNIINGIYITDDRLIEKVQEPDYSISECSVDAINKFSAQDPIPVFVMIAPTSAGIYTEKLPKNTPQLNQHEIIQNIYRKFDSGISAIDVYDILNASKEDYIYYRTDHHWTSLGAYYAYSTAIQKLGFISPIAYSKYDVEHASNDFLGTYYSKTLYDKLQPDTIDIYSYKGGSTVTECTVNSGLDVKSYDSIYFRDFLDTKDKYSTYLGQNQPAITIKTNLQSDKKLLVFKDSYANSFIPFLTQHYSEIKVLDMRYINNYRDYADVNEYSQVLFLYNITTFMEDDNIKKIAY